mgnify:CR=1 FL=1
MTLFFLYSFKLVSDWEYPIKATKGPSPWSLPFAVLSSLSAPNFTTTCRACAYDIESLRLLLPFIFPSPSLFSFFGFSAAHLLLGEESSKREFVFCYMFIPKTSPKITVKATVHGYLMSQYGLTRRTESAQPEFPSLSQFLPGLPSLGYGRPVAERRLKFW